MQFLVQWPVFNCGGKKHVKWLYCLLLFQNLKLNVIFVFLHKFIPRFLPSTTLLYRFNSRLGCEKLFFIFVLLKHLYLSLFFSLKRPNGPKRKQPQKCNNFLFIYCFHNDQNLLLHLNCSLKLKL